MPRISRFYLTNIFFARALLRTSLEISNLFSLLQFPLKLDFASLILAGAVMKSAQHSAIAISQLILTRARKTRAHTLGFFAKIKSMTILVKYRSDNMHRGPGDNVWMNSGEMDLWRPLDPNLVLPGSLTSAEEIAAPMGPGLTKSSAPAPLASPSAPLGHGLAKPLESHGHEACPLEIL